MVFHVGFVVDKVALEQVFLSFFSSADRYSTSAPHLFMCPLGMDD
jgi:hypothetical protein